MRQILLLIGLVLVSFKASATTLTDESVQKLEQVESKPHEVVFDRNQETGVYDTFHFIEEDTLKLSVAGYVNPVPEYFFNHLSVEGSIDYKIKKFWVGAFANVSYSNFESITENSELRYSRGKNERQTLLSLG